MANHDPGEEPRLDRVVAVIMAVVVIGGITDLILDQPTTLWSAHVLMEIGLILVSLGALVYLARGWLGARRTLAETRRDLGQRQQERDAWRTRAEQALAGLGREVSRQCDDWGLTPAERDTALMLLKGFSFRQIANLTGRSERTVRQHAVAVYGKSGLAGRAELSGFFLGDLLLPSGPTAGVVSHESRVEGES